MRDALCNSRGDKMCNSHCPPTHNGKISCCHQPRFYFSKKSQTKKPTTLSPSPADATESLLTLQNWQTLVAESPALKNLQPDVKALLVNRVDDARHFIAPMDVCFELVGLIRKNWCGLSGGDLVWSEIEKFFTRLREQTTPAVSQIAREEIYA